MRPPLHDCMRSRIFTRVPAHFNNVVCASSANCVCVCVCVFIGISDICKYSALNNPIVSHTFCIASALIFVVASASLLLPPVASVLVNADM